MMKQGFTLLELSIVLVIIGLIIGGITAGQDLIRAAELNSIVSDVNKYKVALNTFKLKYNALPGDMDNAIDYWGAAHATPATCRNTASTGEETCNGNGDGLIVTIPTTSIEDIRAWQHMANAGIITGQYSGVSTTGVAGVNVPKAPINGIYGIGHTGAISDSAYPGLTKSRLVFSHNRNNDGYLPYDPDLEGALDPTETASIDEKIDDGIMYKGNFLSGYCNGYTDGYDALAGEGAGYCESNPADCNYDFTSTQGCQVIFIVE